MTLVPCSCGHVPITQESADVQGYWYVICQKCGCHYQDAGRERVIAAWNREKEREWIAAMCATPTTDRMRGEAIGKKLKLDKNDLLNIMQAVNVFKNLFINAYSAEKDGAAKAGLRRRVEELQTLFLEVHNMRLNIEEQERKEASDNQRGQVTP